MTKVIKTNFYGFDHAKVAEQFSGNLIYINDVCIHEEYSPVSIYHAANPDRSKGHKDYMLLQTNKLGGLVRGMDKKEMKKWTVVDAVHCLQCDNIIHSPNRHAQMFCTCDNETMIDGGADYTRYGAKDVNKIKLVTINLLTDKIVK